MNDVDDFLAHYGRKGMKWGVKQAYVKTLTAKSKDGNVGVMSPDGKYRVNTGAERAFNKRDRGNSGVKDAAGKKLSRKELRELNKKNEQEFNQKKLSSVYGEAKKAGDRVIVETNDGMGPILLGGKEFVQYAESGGIMDARNTRVYARQRAVGEGFVANMEPNQLYQPIKKR